MRALRVWRARQRPWTRFHCSYKIHHSAAPLLGPRKKDWMSMSSQAISQSPGVTSDLAAAIDGSVAHHAAIALGSNMGDRIDYIERALAAMSQKGMRVLSVSSLYETKAMYYENQDSFVNGACLVETTLEPLQLLDELQDIENQLGRVRTINKGPRTLDLDIILYDNKHIFCDRLEVPHKLLLEREFVLRPLAQILPDYTFPATFSSVGNEPANVSSALSAIHDPDSPMCPITPLSHQLPFLSCKDPRRSTRLMSILNITPDSFSDGGRYSADDLDRVRSDVSNHIAAGATILDIGGQSTRPNAEFLTAAEELKRVLPVIEAIRSMPASKNVAISIDTFHSEVAQETSKYGVDIINDVSGGLLDPNMLSTVAKLGKTFIMMHMRGNPHTMSQLIDYPTGVVDGVAQELCQRVAAARAAGIPPWRIVLDPGIGFAKDKTQNLQLLKDLALLRSHPELSQYPWLLGVSRKKFVGQVTGVQNASERIWGTAAAVTAAIAGGADIVRVHDVTEMAQVSTMADAIFRS